MKTKLQKIQEKRAEYVRKKRIKLHNIKINKPKKKEIKKPEPVYVKNPKEIPASVFAYKKSWLRRLFDKFYLWYNKLKEHFK